MTDPQLPGHASDPTAVVRPAASSGRLLIVLVALACLLALAASAYVWYSAGRLTQELGRRAADAELAAREARQAVEAVREGLTPLSARLSQLESRQTETQSQQSALSQMYQELARSRDEWVVSDVDQTITLAAQHLQLTGNVQAALVALQAADARLARSDLPQFAGLRRALARDLEALKAMPDLDLAGVVYRLDQVMEQIETLPLLPQPVEASHRTVTAGMIPTGSSWWERALASVLTEVGSWLRVRRTDQPDRALIAPDQAYFVRENMRLRLLNARLAVLSRNEKLFRSDVGAARKWLNAYFDPDARTVHALNSSLAQFEGQALVVETPGLAETLAALRQLKAAGDRP